MGCTVYPGWEGGTIVGRKYTHHATRVHREEVHTHHGARIAHPPWCTGSTHQCTGLGIPTSVPRGIYPPVYREAYAHHGTREAYIPTVVHSRRRTYPPWCT